MTIETQLPHLVRPFEPHLECSIRGLQDSLSVGLVEHGWWQTPLSSSQYTECTHNPKMVIYILHFYICSLMNSDVKTLRTQLVVTIPE